MSQYCFVRKLRPKRIQKIGSRASEAFLQRIVSLFVASHYKNTPNDLQMMSDAPAHHLFCLLGPTPPDSTSLPEVLCVIQVVMQF
jgi:N-acetyltransferase 10